MPLEGSIAGFLGFWVSAFRFGISKNAEVKHSIASLLHSQTVTCTLLSLLHRTHTVHLVCSFTAGLASSIPLLQMSRSLCERSRLERQLYGPRCSGSRREITVERPCWALSSFTPSSNVWARPKGTFCFCLFGEVAFSWYLRSQEKKNHWVFTLAFR